jgi:hypothetical protein
MLPHTPHAHHQGPQLHQPTVSQPFSSYVMTCGRLWGDRGHSVAEPEALMAVFATTACYSLPTHRTRRHQRPNLHQSAASLTSTTHLMTYGPLWRVRSHRADHPQLHRQSSSAKNSLSGTHVSSPTSSAATCGTQISQPSSYLDPIAPLGAPASTGRPTPAEFTLLCSPSFARVSHKHPPHTLILHFHNMPWSPVNSPCCKTLARIISRSLAPFFRLVGT